MASYQSHPLPQPPGGSEQPPQTYAQDYSQNSQQSYQTYQQGFPQRGQQQQPPQPPMHSQQQKQRPKSRSLSFRSNGSGNSGGKGQNLQETSAEKEAKRLHSKADPSMAINEAEPAAVQANVKNSLASIRDMQHRDLSGALISDPDRSNPTRSRWERPLDTIRGFEAAVDGGYNRKSMMIRSDTDSVANWNRRSTHFGGNTARFPQDSYYGARSTPGQYDVRTVGPAGQFARDSYFDQGSGGGSYPPGPSGGPPPHGYPRPGRMGSEPQLQTYGRADQQSGYALPSNHRSYETVASASGSGISAEPMGYQTDPTSSDNSSVDRTHGVPKRLQEQPNDYGIAFAQPNSYQAQAFKVENAGRAPSGLPAAPNQYQNGDYNAAPVVPQKDRNVLARRPTDSSANNQMQARPGQGDKRKSWFSKRFSRQG